MTKIFCPGKPLDSKWYKFTYTIFFSFQNRKVESLNNYNTRDMQIKIIWQSKIFFSKSHMLYPKIMKISPQFLVIQIMIWYKLWKPDIVAVTTFKSTQTLFLIGNALSFHSRMFLSILEKINLCIINEETTQKLWPSNRNRVKKLWATMRKGLSTNYVTLILTIFRPTLPLMTLNLV